MEQVSMIGRAAKGRTFWLLCLALTCFSMTNCQKKLTLEERKANLEKEFNNEACEKLTTETISKVLTNISSIDFQHAGATIGEIVRIGENSLYAQILTYGECKGEFNGKDTIYSFYFYGNIPEKNAYQEQKNFDEEGYNLSLKKDGWFVYSNKEDVDSLNNEKRISEKRIEEFERKKSEISIAKVEEALRNEWKSSNQSSPVGAKECYVNDVRIDDIIDNVIYVSYTLMSQYDSDNIKTVKMEGAKLSKDKNYYRVLSVGIN